MTEFALVLSLGTLVTGIALALALRLLPTVRLQLAGLALLAVGLPLAAVILGGLVMFHMHDDVKILAVAAASASTALAAALLLGAGVARRIRGLEAAAEKLSGGELKARAPIDGPRELAHVGEAFNAMAERHTDGSLTPIAGSPFPVGGAGLGAGLPSQGAIQLSSDGRYLLAVDAASNQISVSRLGPDGVPRPVGAPISSGGGEPLSIAVSGNLVYVANAAAAAPNVSGFVLAANGALNPLPGSTVSLPAASGPDDVLLDPKGHRLVVDLDNTSSIASFRVQPNGLLLAAPGSPLAAQGAGPFGAEFRPGNPSQLFVSNAHGGTGNGTVSVFLVAHTGQLAPIGASPFADLQTAPCWVEISHDGRYLFTVNTGSGEISSYSINADGSLVLIGSTPFGSAGAGAVDARLSPDGKTLLVDGSKAGVIASFAVNGGNLTELASSPTPLPAGASGAGIVTD